MLLHAVLFVFLGMAYADTPRYVSMFRRYDNTQGAMGPTEFHNFWMSFDSNHDNRITSAEFLAQWRADHLPHSDHDLLFFLELDTNHDTVIGTSDIDKLFPIFDKNEDLFIEEGEFVEVWDALFDDVLDLHS